MKSSRFLLGLAAVAVTSFVAVNAGAQDTTVSKGEVAQPHTFVSLVAAVNATPATVEALKARTAIKETDVKLVNASPLIEGNSDSALTAALEKNTSDIEQLRTILGAQAAITEALAKTDPKLTIADVIAADVHVDGTIDVFYRAKAM
jgi:hypothetical protein